MCPNGTNFMHSCVEYSLFLYTHALHLYLNMNLAFQSQSENTHPTTRIPNSSSQNDQKNKNEKKNLKKI